jgi:TnpA family transposase
MGPGLARCVRYLEKAKIIFGVLHFSLVGVPWLYHVSSRALCIHAQFYRNSESACAAAV